MWDEQLATWSKQVKIRGGWVCSVEGCGQIHRAALESHHTVPVYINPRLKYEINNGEIRCLYHHAMIHFGRARQLIFERAALYIRKYGRLIAS